MRDFKTQIFVNVTGWFSAMAERSRLRAGFGGGVHVPQHQRMTAYGVPAPASKFMGMLQAARPQNDNALTWEGATVRPVPPRPLPVKAQTVVGPRYSRFLDAERLAATASIMRRVRPRVETRLSVVARHEFLPVRKPVVPVVAEAPKAVLPVVEALQPVQQPAPAAPQRKTLALSGKPLLAKTPVLPPVPVNPVQAVAAPTAQKPVEQAAPASPRKKLELKARPAPKPVEEQPRATLRLKTPPAPVNSVAAQTPVMAPVPQKPVEQAATVPLRKKLELKARPAPKPMEEQPRATLKLKTPPAPAKPLSITQEFRHDTARVTTPPKPRDTLRLGKEVALPPAVAANTGAPAPVLRQKLSDADQFLARVRSETRIVESSGLEGPPPMSGDFSVVRARKKSWGELVAEADARAAAPKVRPGWAAAEAAFRADLKAAVGSAPAQQKTTPSKTHTAAHAAFGATAARESAAPQRRKQPRQGLAA